LGRLVAVSRHSWDAVQHVVAPEVIADTRRSVGDRESVAEIEARC
jgi:hypothetical protein